MKNHFLKALAISLFLLAMPMFFLGQEVKNHLIEIELEKIENPDMRYCLLANIANDSHFLYTVDDENNSILVFSSEGWDDQQLQTYFNESKSRIQTEFDVYSSAEKELQGVQFTAWKDALPEDLFVLLFKVMLIENPTNRDGNQTCATSDPFCTTDVVTFHVEANPGGSCENGPYYGCLSPYTARPPFWFHMKIGVAGSFTIRMTNSANVDIDYCCWGPFSDPVTPCPSQLTQAKYIDCGSSANATENCQIPNSAQVGQYYIMVITKYNQTTPTDITFQKVAGTGPGETDCGILPGIATNDGPYCVGDAIHLNVNAQEGATYSWSGPGGYTSNQQNPVRPNCTLAMAGEYTCVTTVGTHSVTASTTVQVSPKPNANFTANSVCKGESTQFTNTSTTNPANQNMSCLWDFGDGQTSTLPNPTHQYTNAGNYTATLTVTCGECSSTKTQSVTVYANPIANAGNDQTIIYGATATLSGSGGTGNFNYHWTPADKVVNPNAQTTQTVALQQSTTFTLTVTHPQGGCSSTDQVSILVEGSNMTATASASPTSICLGETSQLQAIGVGGTGNYTYSWTPTIGLSAPNIANPVAHPTQTTTYTCVVSDGMSSQSVSTTVTVNHPEYEEIEQYICPGDSYTFYGQEYSEEGDFNYVTTTAQGCEKVITLHLHHYPSYSNAHTTTAYICPEDSYQFHGQYYSTTGLFSENLHTIHGCDSIVWLDLTVYPSNPIIVENISICESQSLTWYDGNVYNQDGDEAFYDSIDNHGCLQVYQLHLSVGQYQTPLNYDPRKFICVPHDEEPFYHWDIANRDYHQNAKDTIIISNPDPNGCDYQYTLDLKFHREFYHTDTVTVCDHYHWDVVPGSNYTTTDHHIVKTFGGTGGPGFDCDSTFVLDLTVNHSNESEITRLNQCDSLRWYFGNHGESFLLTEQGDYTETIRTHLGCDSTVTMHLQMDYSPDFVRVEGHPWVVGGSEFQYTIEDYWIETHPNATHTTEWSLYNPDGTPFNKWDLVPYGDNGDKCMLYIYTFERDTIELRAHTQSTGDCQCGNYTHSKWIHCGYYNVNETPSLCEADIYPNPNDGNMTLSFDNMMGEVEVSVYSITGTLVDRLKIFNGYPHQTHEYQSNRLSKGVYFFQFISKEGQLTKKVIIFD